MGRTLTVCVGIGVNLKNEKPFPGSNISRFMKSILFSRSLHFN